MRRPGASSSGARNGSNKCDSQLKFLRLRWAARRTLPLLLLLLATLTGQQHQSGGLQAEAFNVQEPTPVVVSTAANQPEGQPTSASVSVAESAARATGSHSSGSISSISSSIASVDSSKIPLARPLANGHNNHRHRQRRPESSSSAWAPLEDLTDSSIRTRLGTVTMSLPQQPGAAPIVSDTQNSSLPSPSLQPPSRPSIDFDRLIDKLLGSARQQQQQQVAVAPAEVAGQPANASSELNNNTNRTTMKFFRNNKTFASAVFTSEPQAPRRLINCHLVDLEKHAPDVAIFESKYGIDTVDVEFEDMMALIESCTDIARFRPFRPPAGQAATGPSPAGSAGQATGTPVGMGAGPAPPPVLVVGRPLASGQQTQPFASGSQSGGSTVASTTSMSTFHNVMTGAIGHELNRLGPTIDDSNKLDIPQPQVVVQQQQQQQQQQPPASSGQVVAARSMMAIPRAHRPPANQRRQRRRLGQVNTARELQWTTSHNQQQQQQPVAAPSRFRAMGAPGMPAYSGELLEHNAHSHPATLLTQALARVGETSKKLVLGEVTPPPSAVDNQRAGIKEALQEITSYDTTDLLAIWRGILPGTNWCGMGDRATSYNDLGFESDIDICCRAHDFCPIRLSAFSSGYGLFNWSFYTRSHCTCDQNFLNCLQRAESPLSSVVMRLYFTIMKTTCLHDNETSAFNIHNRNHEHRRFGHSSPSRPLLQQQHQHQAPLRFHITTHNSDKSHHSSQKHSHHQPKQQQQQQQQTRARTLSL